MDSFNHNDHQTNTQHESCVCDGKQGVFLNNRHMSWALSIILLLNFFIFMIGYFLGKKKVIDQLNHKIDQESLTDHVYSSMYALYDNKVQPGISDNAEPGDETTEAETSEEQSVEQAVDAAAQVKVLESEEALAEESPRNVAEVITVKNDGHEYYAQLVGFGNERAAQQFVRKLAQRDITAHIKQRPSRTAKGRTIYWYQVITESFAKKEELLTLVETIKRREKLHDVRIITA